MTKQDQRQFEEELSDILLIMDKNDKKVYQKPIDMPNKGFLPK